MSLNKLTEWSFRLPVGIDAHRRRVRPVAHLPEDEEAIPLAVGRHMGVQPAQAPGSTGSVIRVRRAEPRRACVGTPRARRLGARSPV